MESTDIAIAWIDLSYSVQPFPWSIEKIILNNLCGSVRFGTITALMGPSGAGKTTLLNCINGKLSEGLDENTKIYLNDKQMIRSSFVAQHEREHLIMCLTVKECLIYASKLKNSDLKFDNTGAIDHKINIKTIMDELMISDICDNRVDCCSGGQQKRLTIALEMVRVVKPKLLCIDEPTTGLDSNVAVIVMQCLRDLAKKHRIAIITSIHQPNQEIVLMFDKLYVMAKGGNCIFSGPPDQISGHLMENQMTINEEQMPIEHLIKLGSEETYNNYMKSLIMKTSETLRHSVLRVFLYLLSSTHSLVEPLTRDR